mgnify:CR=1 FL=1
MNLVESFLIVSAFAAIPIVLWFGFLAVVRRHIERKADKENCSPPKPETGALQ